MIFFQPEYFKDRKGAPVIGGPDGSVLTYLLPPQIPYKDIEVQEVAPAAAVVGDLGQVAVQLTISYFLNNLWAMIST